jgi:hypothetical protein
MTLHAKRGAQFARVPVEDWWESDSVMNASGVSVSRKQIILGAANRDGGAHVDRKLQAFYEHLVEGQFSMGITGDLTYNGEPPFPQGQLIYPPNGHLALIRQFAHECLCTAAVYRWLREAHKSRLGPFCCMRTTARRPKLRHRAFERAWPGRTWCP